MPLEVWVQAAAAGLSIVELPVPLLYLDLTRSFGGALDDAETRLAHYRSVLDRAETAAGFSLRGHRADVPGGPPAGVPDATASQDPVAAAHC
jgi:hypothetical protein